MKELKEFDYFKACLLFFLTAAVAVAGGCKRSDTAIPLDPATLDRMAAGGYQRAIVWPEAYKNTLIKLGELRKERKWDQLIDTYLRLLEGESIQLLPDVRADICASLAEVYLAKSKGTDAASCLLWLSLALDQAESDALKQNLRDQLATFSVALDRPKIATYWRKAQVPKKIPRDSGGF